MTAEVLDPRHPVAATVVSVRRELAAVVGTPVWSMSVPETEAALVDVARLESQVAPAQTAAAGPRRPGQGRVVGGGDLGCELVRPHHAYDASDRPPAACDAHHDIPWSRGGRTDLNTGRLLCPRHHTLAHDARYQLKTSPRGKVNFTRRT